LTFYIFEGLLVGRVAGRKVVINCLSGGGGGTISKRGPDEPENVNNPYQTSRKATHGNRRGGPLPVGPYYIQPPERWGNGLAARLRPYHPSSLGERSGFLIHGRGRLGSDGCIVPLLDSYSFKKLMEDLANDKGGILMVEDSTLGSFV